MFTSSREPGKLQNIILRNPQGLQDLHTLLKQITHKNVITEKILSNAGTRGLQDFYMLS